MAAEEPSATLERRVKVAFLYRFAGYVEWPVDAFASPKDPIVLGIAGDEVMADELEVAVAGREVAGRPLRVRRLGAGVAFERCCHVLFIDRSVAPADSQAMLAHAEGRPVLTVTELDAGAPRGSIINFARGTDRIRFDISLAAAERNRLSLRSQLLVVARNVTPKAP